MDLAYKQEATVGTLVIGAFVLFFVGTTWLSGRSVGANSDKFYKIQFSDAANLKAYLGYLLGDGQKLLPQIGLAPLPSSLDQKAVAQLDKITS